MKPGWVVRALDLSRSDHYKLSRVVSQLTRSPLLIGEGHSKTRTFFSSPIKSLHRVKLLIEVSASKGHAIPRNYSPKKPKIRHRQPFWNKCSVARPLSVTPVHPANNKLSKNLRLHWYKKSFVSVPRSKMTVQTIEVKNNCLRLY